MVFSQKFDVEADPPQSFQRWAWGGRPKDSGITADARGGNISRSDSEGEEELEAVLGRTKKTQREPPRSILTWPDQFDGTIGSGTGDDADGSRPIWAHPLLNRPRPSNSHADRDVDAPAAKGFSDPAFSTTLPAPLVHETERTVLSLLSGFLLSSDTGVAFDDDVPRNASRGNAVPAYTGGDVAFPTDPLAHARLLAGPQSSTLPYCPCQVCMEAVYQYGWSFDGDGWVYGPPQVAAVYPPYPRQSMGRRSSL